MLFQSVAVRQVSHAGLAARDVRDQLKAVCSENGLPIMKTNPISATYCGGCPVALPLFLTQISHDSHAVPSHRKHAKKH